MDVDSSGVLSAGYQCLKSPYSTSYIQPKSNTQYYLGATLYLRDELIEAKEHFINVLMNRELSEAIYVVQTEGILSFIHIAEACWEEVRHIIESIDVDASHNQDAFAVATKDALLVEFALRQGKVDEARRLSVGVEFDLRPPHWLLNVPKLTSIKLLSAQTDQGLKEARARLSEMDEQMGRINRKHVRIDVLALLALVCHKLGEEATALKKLQVAPALAEPGGWVRNFADLGAPMAELLERLDQIQPEHKYAQRVLEGFKSETRSKSPELTEEVHAPILTKREIEILPLLEEGLSNREIAEKLFIATETVKTHLQNIYLKLHAKGRIAALKQARALGLISLD